MSSTVLTEQLVTVDELSLDPAVRRLVRTRSALKRHLANRSSNGLDARKIVHVTPTRRLVVDRAGFIGWLYGLDADRAA